MDISISRHSYIVYSYKKSVYLHKTVIVCHTGFVIQNNKVNIEKEKKSLENHNPYTFLFNQQSTRDKTTKLEKDNLFLDAKVHTSPRQQVSSYFEIE